MEIGKQFNKDSDFKRKARLHQSTYRANVLKVGCDEFGNMLKEEDAKKGLNFYNDFSILQAVQSRYGVKYDKQLYANMLRSEHITFNLFIPLLSDLEYAKNALNGFVSNSIHTITDIQIAYAPDPAKDYLDDRTSFDACVMYRLADGGTGILGIEVKYSEQEYPLKKRSKEDIDIHNPASNYWMVSIKSNLFAKADEKKLIHDDFRQMWRNQLLGESIKQVDKIDYFTSIILYPGGNTHFARVVPAFSSLLKKQGRFKGITYEDFFEALSKHANNTRYENWITYLRERYLFDL